MDKKNITRLRYLQILSVLLVLAMGLALVGCGKKKKNNESTTAATVTVITTEATTEKTSEKTTDKTSEKNTEVSTEKTSETTTEITTEATTEITTEVPTVTTEEQTTALDDIIDEDGSYTSKEDVALYLHTYGRLPQNFITKKEAQKLGWSGGSLERYAPGKCIGGDKFGNYEGLLPAGRYYECDIDTLGKKARGAKRIIYSDDGRIYYTEDHYETFTLLYGEE